MEAMWDQALRVLEVIGVLAGVAGAYAGYRQYRIARRDRALGARPASTNAGDEGILPASARAEARFEAKTDPEASDWVFMVLGIAVGLAIMIKGADYDDPLNHYLSLAIGLVLCGVGVAHIEKPQRIVELDHEALTVTIASRKPISARIPWAEIDSIKVEGPSGRRRIVLRLAAERGFGSQVPRIFWDDTAKGYRICDFSSVEPSGSALLSALRHYSDGRCRVEWD